MDKKMILVAILIVVAVGLAGVGIGSYMSGSNMKKEIAKQQEKEELEKTIEDKINEKTKEEQTTVEEKADAEKKAAAKKASMITADEAYNGYTTKAPNKYETVECQITGKEKKIPSNVDQKAQGGMISCADVKYRVYIGNDDGYYSYKVGNYAVFTAQWIESTKFYLFSEEDLGYQKI